MSIRILKSLLCLRRQTKAKFPICQSKTILKLLQLKQDKAIGNKLRKKFQLFLALLQLQKHIKSQKNQIFKLGSCSNLQQVNQKTLLHLKKTNKKTSQFLNQKKRIQNILIKKQVKFRPYSNQIKLNKLLSPRHIHKT